MEYQQAECTWTVNGEETPNVIDNDTQFTEFIYVSEDEAEY